ncbi:DUF397 domain-containing protein [Sphaerisporangium viridialbum]|uniref:DUF397 domain-containing protein n=1 Tax=Sphaerisporangium viridialbum TaxID=46189 RepID=UPI003C789D0E
MERTPSALAWRKSTYSGQQENCVEVAVLAGGGYALRDSKNPDGPVLSSASDAWQAFIRRVKNGGLT